VPLGTRGDDANAKQFASLHAVQRHMVDTNQCKMVYEGNEDEYEGFYEYGEAEEEDPQGGFRLRDERRLVTFKTRNALRVGRGGKGLGFSTKTLNNGNCIEGGVGPRVVLRMIS
jgi:hypothetical protein